MATDPTHNETETEDRAWAEVDPIYWTKKEYG
jgi:hypothetical protein